MNYILNASQMRKVDQFTIENIGIPSIVLMERAALGVTRAVAQNPIKYARCLVITGTGNNGGDGLACARQLKEKGYCVDVLILGKKEHATDSFLLQLHILKKLAVSIVETCSIKEYDCIIDGIFGVGLSRPVRGHYQEVIEAVNQSGADIYAIDIPSGIDGTSGAVMGCAVKADVTITFGFLKKGIVLYPGADYAGKVLVWDIGFPIEALHAAKPDCFTIGKEDIIKLLPPRKNRSNKGTYGRLAVFAGTKNMAGAAALSALAAYHSGCGLVEIITHTSNRIILQTLVPEAILHTYEKAEEVKLVADKVLDHADAVVFGPGMGVDEVTRELLEILLTKNKKPLLIDADGLNALAKDKDLLQNRSCPLILTPHLKEMERLTGVDVSSIAASLEETAKDFLAQFDAEEKPFVCVLKDARTIVSENGQLAYINTSGNNGMSTAGAGDVLSGVIGGLLAQKLEAGQAARLGVFLHGAAGDEAFKQYGAYGMTARNIEEKIGIVMHEAECSCV